MMGLVFSEEVKDQTLPPHPSLWLFLAVSRSLLCKDPARRYLPASPEEGFNQKPNWPTHYFGFPGLWSCEK